MPVLDDDCTNDDECNTLFDVRVVHTTAKALLIKTGDGCKHWIPRSVIVAGGDIERDAEAGAEGTIYIVPWFIAKEGPFE
jgi:hypothetical protein